MRREPPLPSFLIIGAQKSATRWLRSHLGEHPEIFSAPRELEFFDKRFDEGPTAYRAGFHGWRGEPSVGEATPGYMIWRNDCETMAGRVEAVLGRNVRLIAILRNPVDRTYSAFRHHMARDRIPLTADLIETIRSRPPEQDSLSLISGGWYAASLEPYVRRFGDRLLVLLHDDLAVDAAGVYRRVVEHIGADGAFVPGDLTSVLFSTDEVLPEGTRRRLTDDERAVVLSYFAADIDQLGQLVDVDVSTWALP